MLERKNSDFTCLLQVQCSAVQIPQSDGKAPHHAKARGK